MGGYFIFEENDTGSNLMPLKKVFFQVKKNMQVLIYEYIECFDGCGSILVLTRSAVFQSHRWNR